MAARCLPDRHAMSWLLSVWLAPVCRVWLVSVGREWLVPLWLVWLVLIWLVSVCRAPWSEDSRVSMGKDYV